MLKSINKKLFSRISIAVFIFVVIFTAVVYLAERGCNIASEISENFKTGKVTTEFRDYVSEIKGVRRLQVASLKTTDIFTRVDSRSILWELIDLPDVEVEIKLPVEYNYYLDLKDKWNFLWDENTQSVRVIAPKIKPNTTAVNISEMRVSIIKGSFLRNVDEVKDSLFKELMPRLDQLAYEKINLIKETARKEVSDLISNWFKQIYLKNYDVNAKLISVYFEDEIDQTNPEEPINIDIERR